MGEQNLGRVVKHATLGIDVYAVDAGLRAQIPLPHRQRPAQRHEPASRPPSNPADPPSPPASPPGDPVLSPRCATPSPGRVIRPTPPVLLPRRLRAAHARSTAAAGHGEHAWATPSALSLPALCPAIVRVLLSSVSPCRTTHTRSVMHAACCLLPLQLQLPLPAGVFTTRERADEGEGRGAAPSAVRLIA